MVLVIAAACLTTAAPTGESNEFVPLLSAGRGIRVRIQPGWHLVQRGVGPSSKGGRPVPFRPAVLASFPVAFSRHPCPCASPNYRNCGAWCHETGVRNFPAGGALVFMWEFASPRDPADLGRGYVLRPPRFWVTEKNPQFAEALGRELRGLRRKAGHACVEGPGSLPSWSSGFRPEAGCSR